MADMTDDTNKNKNKQLPVPAVPTTDLSKTLAEGQKAITQAATTGPAGVPLDDRDASFYLNQIDAITKDPEFQAKAPTTSKEALLQARNRAAEIYEDKTNKNDWLEVAQTLGRAVAQFGAAQAAYAGGNRYSGANIPIGQPLDFERRNERAFKELQQSNLDAKLDSDTDRQEALDRDRVRAENLRSALIVPTAGLSVSEKKAAVDSQEKRADDRLRQQMGLAQMQESGRLRREEAAADKFHTQNQLKDLNIQEKSLVDQLKAGQELANALRSEDDLSKKSLDKVKEKYSTLAGKAGVDIPSAVAEYEAKSPKRARQILGLDIPFTETVDTAATTPNGDDGKPVNTSQDTLYGALGLKDKLDKLQEIRAKQRALTGSGSPAPAASSGAPAPVSGTLGTVRVQGPSGAVAEMPAAAAQKYLSKPGYKRID